MIRVENTLLPVVAASHPGMKGKNNEDRFGVSAFKVDSQSTSQVLLAVLSDGIGGHRAGEVASELAVDVISQYVAESDGRNPGRILQEAIHLASETIHQQALENPEQQGMGATCACVWIADNRLFTANVGDSRIYLMRSDQIYQLSVDHTWIQEALERGLIQPDQVEGHPNAHVIRRYLGSPTLPEVDFRMRVYDGETDQQSITNQGMVLRDNDRLLLCSDGLTDLVEDHEILAVFRDKTMDEAANYLVELSNQRGGHDNITLIAVQIPSSVANQTAAPATTRSFSRFLVVGCLGAILLGVLAGGVMGGFFIFSHDRTPTPPARTVTLPAGLPDQTRMPSPSYTLTAARSSPTPRATLTDIPLEVPSYTPTLGGLTTQGPTITPWPTNTPNTPLPVVTVVP
jgi:protein phosphatase